MSANLVAIGLVRAIQAVLVSVTLYHLFAFKATANINVICSPSNDRPPVLGYNVGFPFKSVRVESPRTCSDHELVVDYVPVGLATVTIFYTMFLAGSLLYAFGAIIFYGLKHELYEAQQRYPIVDLVISFWIGVVGVAAVWIWGVNYGDLQNTADPNTVLGMVTICKHTDSFCTGSTRATWDDLRTLLFLGIGVVVSWAISVWFIFTETGLSADDEDSMLDQEEPPAFVSFADIQEKRVSAEGHDGPNDDEIINYLRNMKNYSLAPAKLGFDFKPGVPTISETLEPAATY